jgi:hypothetical protein
MTERESPGNSFRDGKVHVVRSMCNTCIFRPGNPMHMNDGAVEQMIESALAEDSAIDCHKTLSCDTAVCAGFAAHHGGDVLPLRLAAALGVIEKVEPREEM